jgi:hydrogenase maturation protease
MRRVSLLVCGEPMRGDDSVAQAVVNALPSATLRLVDVRRVGQLMPDDLLEGDGATILLDAVAGPAAGEVIDLPLASLVDAEAMEINPASTHALPPLVTLGIAARLRGSLPEGRFLGIAGRSYGIGSELSPEVRAAVPGCAARLDHWIRVLVHESRSVACA